jgi:argininosuccinate lyase
MTDPLWNKPGVRIDPAIQAFLAGDDVVLDREFFAFDIRASIAHAEGLRRIGVLSDDEAGALRNELDALADDFEHGRFALDATYEDGHSAIEARLVERLGETGKKIHTGRSRNDQVLVATRLWLKDRLGRALESVKACASIALDRAEAERHLPLPGYTHMQRAVVSSAGMWWAGWAEAFVDDAQRLRDTRRWIDANPLGSAAGYGVNLPLDRDHATQALGFGRLQVAATYAQLSRGKFEMAAIEALGSALLDLRRLAWDLSLYTSAEFGFVELPAQFTTGS